jgi:hypothetical protein
VLDKRSVVLIKDEVTYNTDPVPTNVLNAILMEDVKWAFEGVKMYQQKPVRPSLALLRPLYAGTLIKLTGKVELKGSGAAGTAPECGAVLRAAGFSETVVAVTSVTYKPVSDPSLHKSSTVYFYDDGLLLKMTGCRAKISFQLNVAQAPMATVEFAGHFVSVTDVALPTPTYNAQLPVPLINVPFTIGAYAAVISKLDFDLGNELVMPTSIAASMATAPSTSLAATSPAASIRCASASPPRTSSAFGALARLSRSTPA